jgi:hypothetical protein
MTQTPIAPATYSISAPLTPEQLRRAAFDAADITTLDSTLVYPGIKLLWFGENTCDGDWDHAAALMNEKAAEVAARAAKMDAPAIYSERQVEALVAQIAALAAGGEDYTAARLERDLWDKVLEAIASGHAQAGYLAAAALETKKIDFSRPGA